MEMPNNETIKQAVMAGMGLGFLSLHTLALELRAGLLEIVPLDAPAVVRTWNIVRMRSKIMSPAAEALRYFILEHGEEYLVELVRPWLPAATGGGRPAAVTTARA
jgi:DNA-binding transcriptional LysR family regulator